MKDKILDIIDPLMPPTTELHVHLEGSISDELFLNLLAEDKSCSPLYEVPLSIRDYLIYPPTFEKFSKGYDIICNLVRDSQNFSRLVSEVIDQLVSDNVEYAEVTWTPLLHADTEEEFREKLSIANIVRDNYYKDFGIQVFWILDVLRDRPDMSVEVANWITNAWADGDSFIAALGLGGTENNHPTEAYEMEFGIASKKELPIIPHLGEHPRDYQHFAQELAFICSEKYKINRIGHGINLLNYPNCIDKILKSNLVLEICLSSNFSFGYGAIQPEFPASTSNHQISRCIEQNIPFCINTDDRFFFRTNLKKEWNLFIEVMSKMGMSEDEQIAKLNQIRRFTRSAQVFQSRKIAA